MFHVFLKLNIITLISFIFYVGLTIFISWSLNYQFLKLVFNFSLQSLLLRINCDLYVGLPILLWTVILWCESGNNNLWGYFAWVLLKRFNLGYNRSTRQNCIVNLFIIINQILAGYSYIQLWDIGFTKIFIHFLA